MFGQDLRYAVRQLRMSPGFTLTAVLTLALGIGGLTTVATWTNAVLFNPWPQVRDARSLRFISATVLGSNGYSVHYDQLQFIRQQSRSFSEAAAFEFTTLNLALPNTQPQAINGGIVSANYFQLLGLKPEIGTFFAPNANDRAYGSMDAIVLSDGLWRDRFNADPSLAGRVISINKHAFTVVGVAPREFAGIYGGIAEQAWVPLSAGRDLSADAPADPLLHQGLQVVVRVRPGVSDKSAEAELHTLARSFALAQHNDQYNSWDLNLDDSSHMQKGFFGVVGYELPVLFGASCLLMLLVCINIASLLGQHAARRRREVAIRTALGAKPARIARQVLVETGLLALTGALAGWAASIVISRSVYALLPNLGFSLAFNLHSDYRITLFVASLAIVITLVCGMYPIRQSLRVSQREALHEGATSVAGASRKRYGQRILLGIQLGVCFIVLACCGLLTRTALNIFNRPVGFDRSNTITAIVDLSRSGYDDNRARIFLTTLLDRLRTSPGVTSATVASHLPMGDWGSGNTRDFSVPGHVPAKGEDTQVVADFDGPDFFRTMGIVLQQGRDFAASDNENSPKVAIVNTVMAQRYWPRGNAIGSTIVIDKLPRQIIGIAPEFAYHSPDNTDHDPLVFLPMLQGKSGYGYAIVAVHAQNAAAGLPGQLRRTVAALDPFLPIEQLRTLDDVTGQQYQISRIPAELLGVYALCSVLVAMMGLYAVMAYSVIERNREFAVRMALGSSRSGIFRLVLQGSASVILVGLIVGGAGSIAGVRLLRSMLFNVAPFDPISFSLAAVALILTVLLAGVAPARRAAGIEPMQALRTE
ncbi:ABC transporter permease [Occallatibacter savannae]|uniref:ABC transporter permease n=1 Tax=Occallatibacter savannae TaxID=1002691 RepID=UPI000D68D1CA|nr:ABC transporter permease [Occallatibacter savannae]